MSSARTYGIAAITRCKEELWITIPQIAAMMTPARIRCALSFILRPNIPRRRNVSYGNRSTI
jgi:hypothetical protein